LHTNELNSFDLYRKYRQEAKNDESKIVAVIEIVVRSLQEMWVEDESAFAKEAEALYAKHEQWGRSDAIYDFEFILSIHKKVLEGILNELVKKQIKISNISKLAIERIIRRNCEIPLELFKERQKKSFLSGRVTYPKKLGKRT